jgi:signal transduction histidine kinase
MLVMLCIGIVLGYLSRVDESEHRGIGLWSFGMLVGALAFVLLALRGQIPLPLSVVGGITLAVSCIGCMVLGVERFFGLRLAVLFHGLCILLVAAWQCLFLFGIDDVHARITGFNLVLVAQLGYAVYRLRRELDANSRAISLLTRLVMIATGVLFFARAWLAFPEIGQPSGNPDDDPTRAADAMLFLLLLMLLGFSFVVMLFRRQTLSLKARTAELAEIQAGLEQRVREQSARLAETEKLASVGVLASGVGHEISNPNQVIAHNLLTLEQFWDRAAPLLDHARLRATPMGTTNLAELAPKVRRGLGLARDASRRISRIIGDLRAFSQPEQEAVSDWHDLNDILRAAVRFTEAYLQQRQACLQLCLPDAPLVCFCRAHRIEQVAINLLRNAADALTAPHQAIEMVAARTPEGFCFSVTDPGRGIAPEHLARVTSPFFTTRRDQGGTGLGLYLVARIVEAHHGQLRIRSEPGAGTQVEVRLPASETDTNSERHGKKPVG